MQPIRCLMQRFRTRKQFFGRVVPVARDNLRDLKTNSNPTTEFTAGNFPKGPFAQRKGKPWFPVHYAYHVTNINAEQSQPQWKELLWRPVENLMHNGKVLRQAPAVFFTTTTWKTDIPTASIYPLSGKKGEYYWCVKVPISHFNCYKHILWIHRYEKQVKLFLAKDKEVTGIPPEILDRLKARGRAYCCRESEDQSTYKYYSNDYADESTKYFVNFVVCHSFKLGDDAEWIKMAHVPKVCNYRGSDYMQGKQENNEIKRVSLLAAFKNRIKNML